MKPYICQIAFSVSNLGRSIKFYRDMFDLEDSGRIRFSGPDADYVQGIDGIASNAYWLQDGRRNFQLEFFEFLHPPIYPIPKDRTPSDINITRVAFEVIDMEGTLASARKLGAASIVGPRSLDGKRHAVLKDPDGIVLELIEASQGLSSGRKSRVAGVAMSVNNLEETTRLYVDGFSQRLSHGKHADIDSLLGLQLAERKLALVEGEHVWLELSEYINPKPKPRRDGHLLTDIGISHIAYSTDTIYDFKAMYKKVIDGKWLKPNNPKPLSKGNLAAFMYSKDSDGFTIETSYQSSLMYGLLGFRAPNFLERAVQKFLSGILRMQYKKYSRTLKLKK